MIIGDCANQLRKRLLQLDFAVKQQRRAFEEIVACACVELNGDPHLGFALYEQRQKYTILTRHLCLQLAILLLGQALMSKCPRQRL